MDSSSCQKSDSMFGVIHVYLPSTSFDKSTFLQILIVSGKKRKTKNFSRVGKSLFDPREIRFLSLSTTRFSQGKNREITRESSDSRPPWIFNSTPVNNASVVVELGISLSGESTLFRCVKTRERAEEK